MANLKDLTKPSKIGTNLKTIANSNSEKKMYLCWCHFTTFSYKCYPLELFHNYLVVYVKICEYLCIYVCVHIF